MSGRRCLTGNNICHAVQTIHTGTTYLQNRINLRIILQFADFHYVITVDDNDDFIRAFLSFLYHCSFFFLKLQCIVCAVTVKNCRRIGRCIMSLSEVSGDYHKCRITVFRITCLYIGRIGSRIDFTNLDLL